MVLLSNQKFEGNEGKVQNLQIFQEPFLIPVWDETFCESEKAFQPLLPHRMETMWVKSQIWVR